MQWTLPSVSVIRRLKVTRIFLAEGTYQAYIPTLVSSGPLDISNSMREESNE